MTNNNRRFILEKMLRHDFIGGKHTNIENIPKGKPRNEYPDIISEAKRLIKEGFIKTMPKPDGLHISLEPTRLNEIIKEVNCD